MRHWAASLVLIPAALVALLFLLRQHHQPADRGSPADACFQTLDLRESVNGTKNDHPKKLGGQRNFSSSYRDHWLELFHRDSLSAAHNLSGRKHHLEGRMRREAIRVAELTRRLAAGGTSRQPTDLGSDVVPGTSEGSGEYFVRIGVGSPPTEQLMVVDSGSDIVWLQCQPCSHCYPQADTIFDPATSASFAAVSCASATCGLLQQSATCRAGRCRYEVSYGDGSYTEGTLVIETLTFSGGGAVRDVAIGCGHANRGLFVGAAGLLGLGGGSMSLVGQLWGQAGGAFSYCLASRVAVAGATGSGSLALGRGAFPEGAAWAPLLRNPFLPSLYYIGLAGLGVGAERIPVPESAFRLTELGEGGVVIDTGTAVTRFPGPVYEALRDAFVEAAGGDLPRAPGAAIFDACYDLSGFETVRVPTVSFYFSGGPVLTLPADNLLIPVDEAGIYCFAFAASASALSIIGNIQQEGIQISIDAANGFVGFGPNIC